MADSVIVIHPVFRIQPTSVHRDARRNPASAEDGTPHREHISTRTPQHALEEAVGLAEAINLLVKAAEVVTSREINPATLIGRGNVDIIAQTITDNEIGLAVINHPLSPVQQRNLEKAWNCKVIDRTGLILEIFGARARTREGKLQVELAALSYQRSRLVRSWTHLERQRGGFGFTGGPGETQIEIDRRLTDERIVKLKDELDHVRKNRDLQRQSRRKVPFPIVAFVGYTNAGKSTLFNTLTGADVFAKDLLFATLDTTMRGMQLPSGRKVILSDTVGFISDLPHQLVAAFRATLEEIFEAAVILHVRDFSSPDSDAEKADVHSVLTDIGLEPETDPRLIEVLNKIDLLPEDEQAKQLARSARHPHISAVSAVTGAGLDDLKEKIDVILGANDVTVDLKIDVTDGKTIAWLYDHAHVLERLDDETSARMTVSLAPANYERFKALHPDLSPEKKAAKK